MSQVTRPLIQPSLLWLVMPKLRAKWNRTRTDEGRYVKFFVLGFVGLFFWTLAFAIIFRMLLYFRSAQGIGDVLATKLFGLALLTFLMILLLSNVITALSTFFLSQDLELLAAAPVDAIRIYAVKLGETIVNSSWMVGLMVVPLVAAYGVIYNADLSFYLIAAAVLLPLALIPAVIGSATTLLLVNVFPARRTRDLLALIGLFAAAGVVALFRFLRPERLVRPEEFRDLVDFVAVLRTPSSPWLPSEWASTTIMSALTGGVEWFPFLLLWSTAAAFLVLGSWLHARYYGMGFTRAQEGAERRAGRTRRRWVDRVLLGASIRTRELVAKEVRVFFRDTTQWSQLILLAVLVIVYIYNIRALPLYTGERVSFFLIHIVSFLNLGLAGFVLAAIAARFVFPAMSIEGRMMWLLRSSPLDMRTVFWSKYWVGTVPLLAVAVPLIVTTNLFLQVSPFFFALSTATIIAATFAISALALGFGALYPQFETENVAEIPTSFGGLLYMMSAAIYLAGIVVLEAWPMYLFLQARFQGVPFVAASTVPLLLGLGGAGLLTLLAVTWPLRAGVRRFRTLEF
ncbi:MAG: hypothetical protein HY701_13205 [Gemmatimonadetes bacterium]|nr:hypothetical protein [Gemmatimonadota bacterium]